MKPPILIGGIGRSGTTILALMLDSHPGIFCGPELHFYDPPNLGPYIVGCIDWHLDMPIKECPEQFVSGRQFVARCERMGVTPTELRTAILDRPGAFVEFPHRCELIDRLCRFASGKRGKVRWGLKIMRDIDSIPKYEAEWPGARFIHVIKDPRENAASLLRASFGAQSAQRAAEVWLHTVNASFSGARSSGAHMMALRWEDLCQHPEAVMRAVLDWLGETWHPDVLCHHTKTHALLENPHGHPSAEQVSRPVNTRGLGRWRKELTPEQADAVVSVCGEQMQSLGYEP